MSPRRGGGLSPQGIEIVAMVGAKKRKEAVDGRCTPPPTKSGHPTLDDVDDGAFYCTAANGQTELPITIVVHVALASWT